MKLLNEVESAWLAGVIDGEGSVYLGKHTSRRSVLCQIIIANTNLAFIQKVYEITQCGIIKEYQPLGTKYGTLISRKKGLWNWRLSGMQNCASLLKQILPFLIIKTSKAKQIILFADFRKGKGHHHYGAYEKAIIKGDIMQIEEIQRLL